MKRIRTRPGRGPRPSTQLVEAHLGDVHRYLVYLTGDRALAEDLTADAFERAWKQRDRFDPRRAGPRSWLLAIARSCALDHLRAERRRGARERLAAHARARAGAPRTPPASATATRQRSRPASGG